MRNADLRATFSVVKRAIALLTGSVWADAALAAALAALAEFELWSGSSYQGSPVFPGPRLATALAVIPLMTVPLVLRRRRPSLAFAVVMATIVWSSLALGGAEATSFFLVALVAVYSAVANGAPRAPVAVVATVAIAVHELRDPHVHGIGDVVWAIGFAAISYLFGVAVRGRERRSQDGARAAVVDERARIARELHDIVAHAVSVVVVQAQAGQRLVGVDDDATRQSLVSIEETSRTALNEMRRLLGLLRENETSLQPNPGLDSIDALVDQVRDAGLPVSVRVEGEPMQLAAGIELSAFRVVQEGLTNALKHAGATSVAVLIRYTADGVEIDVVDDGPGTRTRGETGYGLLGIRERVELYGGAVESGRRSEGGWRLRARLPAQA